MELEKEVAVRDGTSSGDIKVGCECAHSQNLECSLLKTWTSPQQMSHLAENRTVWYNRVKKGDADTLRIPTVLKTLTCAGL